MKLGRRHKDPNPGWLKRSRLTKLSTSLMIMIFADNRPNFTATTSRTFISSCNTSTEVSPVWGWNVPNVLDMWKLSGGQFIKMSTLSFCDWDTCLKYGVCVLCYCACILRICSSSAKAKWTKSITVGQTMWF